MASGSRINEPIFVRSFLAAEALLAHRIVIWDSSTAETVRYNDSNPDTQKVGVTLAGAASGAQVEICMFGPCIVTVNGNSVSIVAGDLLEGGTGAGIAVKRAASDGSTYREVLGFSMGASSADGDEISVFVNIHAVFTS